MLYRKSVGRSLHAKVMEEVGDVRHEARSLLQGLNADLH